MAFNINQRLNGLHALSYMGDNAVQPPDFVTKQRPPNSTDSKNFALGDIWLDTTGYPGTLPKAENIWMLVALVGNQATWVNFSGGSSEVLTLTGDDGIAVFPLAGNINVIAGNATDNSGSSVNITGTAHTLTLNVTDSKFNTIIGNGAGRLASTGASQFNVGLGYQSLASLTSGDRNVAIGSLALNACTTGEFNVAMGTSALDLLTTGLSNTVIGHDTFPGGTGSTNLILGQSAGGTLSGSESNNVLLAYGGVSGYSGHIAIGNPPTFSQTFLSNYGTGNTFLGSSAGNTSLTVVSATGNTGIGTTSLSSLTTGASNVAVGGSLILATTSSENTAIGVQSLAALTTGTGANISIGHQSMLHATTASANVIVGYQAGISLLTGTHNTILGASNGGAYVGSESYNILIGSQTNGSGGDNRILRIGDDSGNGGANALLKAFIAGIRGVTTDANDAIPVLISSTGQLGTVSSSARYKENIEAMGNESAVLYKLRPVCFDYKNRSSIFKSVGLIAEEVDKVSPRLVVHDEFGEAETVKYQDLVPMLLNELQKLNNHLQHSDLLLSELTKRIEILESKQ